MHRNGTKLDLDALRIRVGEGEDELAVVLPVLAEKAALTDTQRRRFAVLLSCSAYLEATMLLASADLDNGAIDIEVAYRSVPTAGSHGRAEICGPLDNSSAKQKTPEQALCAAYIMAKIERLKNGEV